MTTTVSPVRRVQLWEGVAAELRRAILLGQLPSGEHLAEAELAQRMRVSRGPVRQALRHLELESLVEVQPNGRALVVGFSREGIEHLYDARLCLEAHALALAAERITADDVRRLQRLLDGMVSAQADGREWAMAELDMAFHQELFVVAGNRVLAQLRQALNPQIRALLEITNVINPRVQSIAEWHQRILDALAGRRTEEALAALTHHLNEAQEVLLNQMNQRSLIEPDGRHPASGQLAGLGTTGEGV